MRTVGALVALLAVATLQVIVAQDPPAYDDVAAKCKETYPITDDELQTLTQLTVPTSADGQCFVGCVFEAYGLLENGQFNREYLEKYVNTNLQDDPETREKYLKLINICSEELGTERDKCVSGPKLFECIVNNAEALGIETGKKK